MTLEIDLVEALHGTEKTVTIPREETCSACGGSGARRGSQPQTCRRCGGHGVVVLGQGFFRIQQTCGSCGGRGTVVTDPCPTCRGAGRVEIQRTISINVPPGAYEGQDVPVPGEGEAGEPGAPPGNLFCILRVRKHPIFVRDGLDLHCEVPITFSQAALGSAVEVPTLEGKIVTQTLKRGMQSGDEWRIPGQGMPHPRGGRRGDLVVHVKVETPRNLTKRQEELFRELAEIDKKNVPPQRKSFLDKVRDFFKANAPPDGAAPEPRKP
jgi:molecular chaperone DnaJ